MTDSGVDRKDDSRGTKTVGKDDRPTFARAMRWSMAWMGSYVAVTVLFKTHVLLPGGASYLLALLPSVLGVVGIWSYIRFLRDADGMQRKIQLEALALGFGAGSLAMMGYRLLERAGAPPIDPSDPFLVMIVFWGVGMRLATRRYR